MVSHVEFEYGTYKVQSFVSWQNWIRRRGVETRGKALPTNCKINELLDCSHWTYCQWRLETHPLSGQEVTACMCQSSCQTLVSYFESKPDSPCWWGSHWLHAWSASWQSPHFPSWPLSWVLSPESPGIKLTIQIPTINWQPTRRTLLPSERNWSLCERSFYNSYELRVWVGVDQNVSPMDTSNNIWWILITSNLRFCLGALTAINQSYSSWR